MSVFLIFAAEISHPDREIEIQPAADRMRIAVGDTCAPAPSVGEGTVPADGEVIGSHLAVESDVVARQRVLVRRTTNPPANLHVAPVGAPEEIPAGFVPPRIHPAGAYGPVAAEVELCTYIRYEGGIIQKICFQAPKMWGGEFLGAEETLTAAGSSVADATESAKRLVAGASSTGISTGVAG